VGTGWGARDGPGSCVKWRLSDGQKLGPRYRPQALGEGRLHDGDFGPSQMPTWHPPSPDRKPARSEPLESGVTGTG
jgi:hypothetical protein